MSTALTIREALEFSHEIMSARQMLPDHVNNPGQALAIIMAGQELGLGPMSAFREIILIKGKTTLTAKCLLGLTHAAGIDSHWEESTAEIATLTLTRPGKRPQTFSFSMADAKRAGLGGHNWNKYPHAMLMARCISKATRAVCPEVTMGAYVHGELTDGNAEPEAEAPLDITPEPEPPKWGGDPKAQGRFFALLKELNDAHSMLACEAPPVEYEELAAWCESISRPRPSRMQEGQRVKLLDYLATDEGRVEYETWLGKQQDSEAIQGELI